MNEKYVKMLKTKIRECKDALSGREKNVVRFDKRSIEQRLRRLEAELAKAEGAV